jgi:hypothetical protein
MDDRRRPSQMRGGFSPDAAAALIERVAGAFDVSAGVIDFDDAPWSEVIHRYSWRRAPRISLAGLPEPMRRELAWWLCSLHSGGERVTPWALAAWVKVAASVASDPERALASFVGLSVEQWIQAAKRSFYD